MEATLRRVHLFGIHGPVPAEISGGSVSSNLCFVNASALVCYSQVIENWFTVELLRCPPSSQFVHYPRQFLPLGAAMEEAG
jgi:hypothetical protein